MLKRKSHSVLYKPDSKPDIELPPAPPEEGEEGQLTQNRRPAGPKWPRLSFEDPRQKRYFYNMLRFLALLLVLTLVARGTAGAALPAVEVIKAQSGEITQSVTASGSVKTAGELVLPLPDGLLVEKALVKNGQRVQKGEGLVQFDLADLEEALLREEASLGEMQAKWNSLQHNQAPDSTALASAQNAYAWAQQDTTAARAKAEASLAGAQQALDSANAAAANAAAALASLPQDATPEARAAAEAALAEANAAVQNANAALQKAGAEATENQQNAARAEESARQALASAQNENAAAHTSAADTASQNKAAAQTLALDITKSEKRIAELTGLVANGGVFAATKDGTVQSSPAGGDTTGKEGPPLSISDEGQGFVAEVALSRQDAEKLQPGAACELTAETAGLFAPAVYTGTLQALSAPGEDGQVKATVRPGEGDWKAGDALRVKFTLKKSGYPLILPLGALHAGSGGYYLLAVEEAETVLGKEERLAQITVTPLAQDEKNVAVEGPLSPETRVVAASDKPLAAGDRVRVGAA